MSSGSGPCSLERRVEAALSKWREASSASPSSENTQTTAATKPTYAPGTFSSDPQLDERIRHKRMRLDSESERLARVGKLAAEATNKVCRPWRADDFLNRCETFKASTWFARQATKISPSEAARHGWVNVGIDTLKCALCESVITVPSREELGLDDDASFAALRAAQEKVVAPLLRSAHLVVCPWRDNPFEASRPHITQPSNSKELTATIERVKQKLDRAVGL